MLSLVGASACILGQMANFNKYTRQRYMMIEIPTRRQDKTCRFHLDRPPYRQRPVTIDALSFSMGTHFSASTPRDVSIRSIIDIDYGMRDFTPRTSRNCLMRCHRYSIKIRAFSATYRGDDAGSFNIGDTALRSDDLITSLPSPNFDSSGDIYTFLRHDAQSFATSDCMRRTSARLKPRSLF